ncbi:UDP-GalNAc:beta-1,3-N-acetylgalactosaminyltransferase 1-like [Watersipora subatra]|uniref:UDP-GalNAc:beta-1, 3-N-acetylgalactosaminyltransferase 1-like n=1 Tax=Watersipora subatra TaxID=2589382 RepID=UPI00355BEDDB
MASRDRRFLWLLMLTIQIAWSWQHTIAFDYILADLSRCIVEKPDILIWVQGRATSAQQRSMIRETFSNSMMWPGKIKVMTIFILGVSPKDSSLHQSRLEYEFEMYNDIVQADFIEAYTNQTYKLMTAINYISDHCKTAKLILRIDDDIIFHPRLLLEKLLEALTKRTQAKAVLTLETFPPKLIACHLIDDFDVWRLKDHPKHFNAVDDSVLPGITRYPPFCAGFFVAMSGDVPRLLQPHIAKNKPFWMDDRYMGVLQKYASIRNITINDILDFGYRTLKNRDMADILEQRFLVRHLPGKQKAHIWQLFQYLSLTLLGLKQNFEPIHS